MRLSRACLRLLRGDLPRPHEATVGAGVLVALACGFAWAMTALLLAAGLAALIAWVSP